jgi:hypothetical protein
MERVNDLSFALADVLLVVFEHQSTVNHAFALPHVPRPAL